MYGVDDMDNTQLDFFRELENIGTGHAATALSVLLSHRVAIRVPQVRLCGYGKICDLLHGPENMVAGLLVGMLGDLNGFILLVMNEQDARKLADMVMGDMTNGLPEEEQKTLQLSTMKELANILIGSYITAISELTGLHIEASVPDLVIDMAGAVMNLLAVAWGGDSDSVLFMETEFLEDAQSLYGHFFLIPDIASYKTLIDKMGAV